MVTYQQLRSSKPEAFTVAGGAWRKWADQIDQRAVEVRKEIVDGVFGGDVWNDKAADVGRDYVEGLLRGIGKSRDGLESAAGALQKLGRELGEAKHLAAANVQRAEDGGLQVDPQTGLVTVPDLSAEQVQRFESREAAEAYQQKRLELARDCDSGILKALDQATDADRGTSLTLRTLGEPIPTLQQLNARADRMEQRAEEAAGLAEKLQDGPITDEQLERLGDLMAFADDPAFATELHRQLGAEGTLELGGSLARLASVAEGDQRGVLSDIQAQLGQSLAAATDPDNTTHLQDSWQQDLLQAADQKIDIGMPTYQPFGHQILGALLRNGDYSEEFLTAVGDDMYDFEQEHGGSSVWTQNRPTAATATGFTLNVNDPDTTGAGFDPMTGLMDAMGDDPAAAKNFFGFPDPEKPGDEPPERLQYMLDEREWIDDMPALEMAPENYQSPGTSNLGDALEAATIGGGRDRNAAQIMSATVHTLGDDMQGDFPPNMRDSVGNMVAGYIEGVNDTAENAHRLPDGKWASAENSIVTGEDGFHAVFDENELKRVMGSAAHDPDAYATMYDANRAFNAVALERIADAQGQDAGASIQSQGGAAAEVFRTLDEGRSDAIHNTHEQSDAAYNAAIERNGGIANALVQNTVGRLPVPGVGEAADAIINDVVDNAKRDSSDIAAQKIADQYGDGEKQAADLVTRAMWEHRMWPPDNPPPPSLLPNGPDGTPADLSNLTDQQWDDFSEWMADERGGYDRSIGAAVRSVADDYDIGRVNYRDAQGRA